MTSFLKLHLAHCTFPGLRTLVVRKELTTIFESITPDLHDRLFRYGLVDGRNPFQAYGGEKKPDRLIYDNGGTMFFRGLDKGVKRLGASYDIIYLNQAEQCSIDDYHILKSRLRNNKQVINGTSYHQMILDINPRSPRSWEKVYAEDRGIPMVKFWLDDNPAWYNYNTQEWSPEGEGYHDLLAEYTGHERERGYLGNYAAAEGLVYNHFNEDTHVDNINWGDIPSDWEIYAAYDFGTTIISCFCYLAFAVSPDKKQIIQLPKTQIYIAEIENIIEKIKTVENRIKENLGRGVNYRVSDHEGTARQILSENNLSSMPAKKEVVEGIMRVKEFFDPTTDKSIILQQKPRDLAFDPDSKLIGRPQRLLDELLEYAYKTVEEQERNPDKADHPKKEKDHGVDTLRYLIMQIPKGDVPKIEPKVIEPKEHNTLYPSAGLTSVQTSW